MSDQLTLHFTERELELIDQLVGTELGTTRQEVVAALLEDEIERVRVERIKEQHD